MPGVAWKAGTSGTEPGSSKTVVPPKVTFAVPLIIIVPLWVSVLIAEIIIYPDEAFIVLIVTLAGEQQEIRGP